MTQWQQPPQYGQPWPMHYQQLPPGPARHSGFGIASFIISIAAGLMAFVSVAVAGIMETQTPGGIDEDSVEAMLVGFAIIGSCLLALLGALLGLIGCVMPDRIKIFSIIGLIVNAVVIIGVVGLIIVGLVAG